MKLFKTFIVTTFLISASAFARDCAELTDLKSKLNSPVLLNVNDAIEELNTTIFDNAPASCAILKPLIASQKQVEAVALAIEIGILKYTLAIKDTKTCVNDETIKDHFSYRHLSSLSAAQDMFNGFKRLATQINCRY